MLKTLVVRITKLSKHPKYARIMKSYTAFKVHDELGLGKIGDMVRIEETRPLSKDKRFRLVEVIKSSALPHIELKEEPPV